ncbi:Maf family protein [Denitromonas iodatirespirans]|uniref:dTTP/UTP pyrophosphatase n=1 Tax=Denitromonas iodatirespirans TaxID=2795389 RepID=A0A944DNF0_DENI1|nr:Maf family protein [Denitromonas iodatirespirans]MBT0961819.1 septum formation inhibitor Maf [Denitromonas iodatirespirans]
MHTSIYLASNSPRRRELLRQIGVRFDVLVFRGDTRFDQDVDETPHPNEAPDDYVQRVALAKAEGGLQRVNWRHLPARPVLAADTTLALEGRIIGKPEDAAHAREILRALSGTTHTVLTAVALGDDQRIEHRLNTNRVRFRTLGEDDIRRYIATGEPMDKAGAYGIQGRAAMFVEHIEGSYTGIMGLPLFETAELLGRFGLAP